MGVSPVEMLEEALSYPTSGEQGLGRILIGGVLVFFSFLVIPAFLVYGYAVRALGAIARGEETPPAFEDWGGLLVDGVKAFVIGIVYSIVPFLIAVVIGGVAGAGAAVGGREGAGIAAGLGLIGSLLYFVATLVVTYLLMAALTNFAVEGRMGAAFDFETIRSVVTTDSYILAFVLIIAIYIALAIVAVVGGILTLGLGFIVMILLGPFVAFWLYLVVAHLFGSAYAEAVGA